MPATASRPRWHRRRPPRRWTGWLAPGGGWTARRRPSTRACRRMRCSAGPETWHVRCASRCGWSTSTRRSMETSPPPRDGSPAPSTWWPAAPTFPSGAISSWPGRSVAWILHSRPVTPTPRWSWRAGCRIRTSSLPRSPSAGWPRSRWGRSTRASGTSTRPWPRRPGRRPPPSRRWRGPAAAWSWPAISPATTTASAIGARSSQGYVHRHNELPLLSFCPTCQADLLPPADRPGATEAELVRALAELAATGQRSRCVDPAVRLSQLRIAQGRIEEAEEALVGYGGSPTAVRADAAIRLARGEAAAAVALLERQLSLINRAGLLAVPLLAQLVEAELAAGDNDGARTTADELERCAARTGNARVSAIATAAAGRVAAGHGRPGGSRVPGARRRTVRSVDACPTRRRVPGSRSPPRCGTGKGCWRWSRPGPRSRSSSGWGHATSPTGRRPCCASSASEDAPDPRASVFSPTGSRRCWTCSPRDSPTARSAPGCS